MDVKRFLEDNRLLFTPQELDQVNAKLAMHAIRRDEPMFVIQRREIGDLLAWVLTFDDCPNLWLRVGNTCLDVMDFADRYQLNLVKVDKDYRH